MKPTTAILLARPTAIQDRRRSLLIATSTAVAGGLLLVGLRIARVHVADEYSSAFAPFVAETGLRPGTLIATALIILTIVVLVLQALRAGSASRDRRMAALRLAGATPRDVRAVAATEAGGAASMGGILAIWVYLMLWLLLGVIPPSGARLVPPPDLVDIPLALAVVALIGVGGAVAGATVQGRVVVEPLMVYRRGRSPRPGRWAALVVLGGAALLVTATVVDNDAAIFLALCGVVTASIAAGPWLVVAAARALRERPGAPQLLAGWRLEADPRSAGRASGVLILCGVAFQVQAVNALYISGGGFYLAGAALVGSLTLLGAAVALLTLFVGAIDQLLDARQPLAALAAAGADESTLSEMLERQLRAAAVPAVVTGVVAASVWWLILRGGVSFEGGVSLAAPLVMSVAAAVGVGFAVHGATRLVSRLLRAPLRAAVDPSNLRVP